MFPLWRIKMADKTIENLKELRRELEGLNTTFTTKQDINIDVGKIKKELTEELKRELQGRSS